MSSAFSQRNINGVYIPSVLLIVGVAIVKTEWLPYAAAFAAVVGGYKVFTGGPSAPRKVLIPDQFQDFPVTKITKTSHNVAIYRLGLPNPTDILGLPIGQHISLAATPKGADKEVVRSYTPISSDEDQGYVDLLIKSYPQGNISAHVATLKVGQTIKVRGPKGAMVYNPNLAKRIGMIAGGTGITPMLQIARAIERGRPRNGGNDTTKVDLIFANVNPDDILLKEEIDNLAKVDPDFSVYYVLNNPPEKWTGGVGFVTADIIKAKLPAPGPDVRIFICGPPPMVSALKKATESLGYEKARPVSKLDDQVFCF